jgi:hypothetical protein
MPLGNFDFYTECRQSIHYFTSGFLLPLKKAYFETQIGNNPGFILSLSEAFLISNGAGPD